MKLCKPAPVKLSIHPPSVKGWIPAAGEKSGVHREQVASLSGLTYGDACNINEIQRRPLNTQPD